MKQFMDENFLLNSETAIGLYHDYAKEMPIFDFHCHLNPKEIAENKKYRNIAEIWLGGDHYKWRAMRSNGIEERYITGDADDKEKFLKWAETMPYCMGNPLYHWTHLELKRFFGIETILSPETAEEIWGKCNELLQKDEFTARGLIKSSNVKAICTTDDPVDTLEYHTAIAQDNTFDVKVLPAFRPDKCINLEKDGFAAYILKLGQAAGLEIKSFFDLKSAISKRIEFFHSMGCRLSDHGLDQVPYKDGSDMDTDGIFKRALQGKEISVTEMELYKSQLLVFLGKEYFRLGWTMQLHIGAIRNVNINMLKLLGPDTGFDTIGDASFAEPLAKLLSKLGEAGELPKTILYCLNPRDNEVLGSVIGCFQGKGVPGKIQFGSGWWFNDQKDGMLRQLVALANLGLLSRFVGMLTDSRSFLSYTRHEYFRRILCNLLGGWVEAGELPNNLSFLGKIVQDICFINAKNYFGIEM
jgi:glucuronate isomerase